MGIALSDERGHLQRQPQPPVDAGIFGAAALRAPLVHRAGLGHLRDVGHQPGAEDVGQLAGHDVKGRTHRQVVRLVMSDGIGLTAAGLAVGLALSAVMSPAVGSLLFQGSGFYAPVVVLAFVTLVAAAAIASWLPARRATRIAPSAAVRDL